jgi:hypothetical protein
MHAAPAILKAKCVSWESYFYHLPSPILTSSSPPYHTASSKSLKIRCRCALRSRYCNSFLTASLNDPFPPQHRKTRQLPPLELTAYPRVLHSSTPNPTPPTFAFLSRKSRRKSRSHTTGLHTGEPPQNRQDAQRHGHHSPAVRHPQPEMSQGCESHPAVLPTPPPFPVPSSSTPCSLLPPRLFPNLPLF